MRRALERILLCGDLVIALPVTDALADDWNTCANQSGTEAITACTQAITSGKYQANNLSALYFDRGNQWSDQRDDDRAIADYDQAIRLNPDHVAAYCKPVRPRHLGLRRRDEARFKLRHSLPISRHRLGEKTRPAKSIGGFQAIRGARSVGSPRVQKARNRRDRALDENAAAFLLRRERRQDQ